MSPAAVLGERFAAWGGRAAFLGAAGEEAYGGLARRVVAAAAAARAAGIGPGAVVALEGDFSPAAVGWLLGLAVARAVVLPLAGRSLPERRAREAAAGARWRVTAAAGGGGPERIETGDTAGPPDPVVADLAAAGRAGLILCSSGTTGTPKVMLHDFDGLLAPHAERRGGHAYRAVTALLFDHIGGLDLLLRALGAGATLVVPAGRDPEAVAAAVAAHRAEVLPASPTFLSLLLLSGAAARHDLSSLRIVPYGAERMPEPLLARLRGALPGVDFQQRFGTSETNAIRIEGRGDGTTWFRIADAGVEHRVVEGELWLRSATAVRGFLGGRGAERFTADGWFRTGDLVEEEGGWLRVAGRREEVINVGGDKVLPGEVERHLLEMAEVADARVFGVPSPLTGQAVAAEVVWRGPVVPAEARRLVRGRLAACLEPHKVPARIAVVERVATTGRIKMAIGAGEGTEGR